MNKKDWDYQKYGGKLDPEENIFFGPITIRELKASMAMADRILQKKRKEVPVEPLVEPVDEDSGENELNRTFEIDDSENVNSTLKSSKRYSKSNVDCDVSLTCLKDISNAPILNFPDFVNDSRHSLSKREDSTLKNRNLLDDTCPTMVQKCLQTPLIGKKDSNHDVSTTFQTSLKNLSISGENPLDDSCPTIVRRHLQTPLMEKLIKKDIKNVSSHSSLNRTLTNDSSLQMETPRTLRRLAKLSNSFITNLMPENCLINTSITEEESFLEHQGTPDIFKNKRNDIWRKESGCSSNVSSSADLSYKSRLPQLKRTPSKRFFLPKSPFANNKSQFPPRNSPVADYIYKGKMVQSMSKPRHSRCCSDNDTKLSRSDSKIKFCKIPIRDSNTVSKRQLALCESKPKGKLFHAIPS